MQQMIIVWDPRSALLSASFFLFPLSTLSLLLPLCPLLSVLILLNISRPLFPFSFSFFCSCWLEASNDQYDFPRCSFRVTHTCMLTKTPCGPLCACGVGAEWMAVATFFSFFLQALKVFFCPTTDSRPLRATGLSCRRNATSLLWKFLSIAVALFAKTNH